MLIESLSAVCQKTISLQSKKPYLKHQRRPDRYLQLNNCKPICLTPSYNTKLLSKARHLSLQPLAEQ
jgi:hypothetical protein